MVRQNTLRQEIKTKKGRKRSGIREMSLTAQERCQKQPKAKDARREVMPWSCDNTQISRNMLIYKSESYPVS